MAKRLKAYVKYKGQVTPIGVGREEDLQDAVAVLSSQKVDKKNPIVNSNIVYNSDNSNEFIVCADFSGSNYSRLALNSATGISRIFAGNKSTEKCLSCNAQGVLNWSGNSFNIGRFKGGIYSHSGSASYECGTYATVTFMGLLQGFGAAFLAITVNSGVTHIYDMVTGVETSCGGNINTSYANSKLTINTNGASAMVIVSNGVD